MAHKDATALTAVPRLRVLPVGQWALADAVTQREGTEARSGKMQQHATLCLVARTTSRTRTDGYAARCHRYTHAKGSMPMTWCGSADSKRN